MTDNELREVRKYSLGIAAFSVGHWAMYFAAILGRPVTTQEASDALYALNGPAPEGQRIGDLTRSSEAWNWKP